MKCFQKELCHIRLVMDAILFHPYIITATLAVLSMLMVAPRLMADEVEANLIQIIDTSNFPSPDPAGIVYLPSQDAFLVSDSEINEMAIFQGVNVFKVDRHGSLLETFSTIPFSSEPTGVTINPSNNHCFFSDDNRKSIYEIDPGDDGLCLTADDTVTSFATDNNFGSSDPEDVTYGLDSLFISDGANNRVYRISDNNGVFNNVTEDNLITSFDTESLGVTDPEGIVFDSTNDTLFIVGSQEPLIIQTTTYGALLHTIDISTINPNRAAGLTLAPSSEDSTMTNLYMVARGVDNNSDPNENDGAIYELAIPTIITPANEAPVVSAGEDQAITLPDNALLNGSVSDDGMPDNILTATWSKQSGPGEVTFIEPNNPNTTASFSTAGTYILRLTGYDGELYNFDDLLIIVSSNEPVITMNGANPMNLYLGDTFTDPGATAMDDADGDLTALIQSTSNVDTSVVGIYQVTYSVTDSDGYSASASRSVIVSDETSEVTILQSRVSASIDDAEENPNGRMYLTSSDLDLVVDKQIQTVGIRFNALSIPANAIITKAYIQFKADETDLLLDTLLNIAAENTNNALSFDNTDYNISSRTKTNASVSWSPAAWSTTGAMGEDQRTSDLSVIVQEIISQTDWSSGNAIAFIFTGTGTRTAEAYDGDQAGAPLLYLEYTTDADIKAPVITLIGDDPITLNLGDTFNDPGATALDETDGDLTAAIEIVSDVNTAIAGTYTVTYTVTDSDGNSSSLSRTVIVRDSSIAPVLTLIGVDPINLNIGDTFTDPGATAMDESDGDITAAIETVSDVNTAIAGTYTVTYTVTDSDGNSTSLNRSVIVSEGTSEVTVLQSRVSAKTDDAEEEPDGSIDLNSSDLELVFNHNLQTVGVRFTNLSVPENAIITKAYIQFKVDERSVNDADIIIHGESTANALGFTKTDYNISDRNKTNTSVSWSPAGWNIVEAAGEEQRTPDLTAIVQEIVSETGWNSGNAMVFIFTGSGTRTAEAYNGDPAGAPMLYLEYTNDASTIPPVLTLIGNDPINLNVGDTFTDPGATAMDESDGDITAAIETVSDVNTAIAGTYTVTYTVTDSDGNSTSLSRGVIVSNGTSEVTVLQSRVSANTDDAEEEPDGSIDLNSSDLELVFNHSLQTVGVRFTNLSIPENAIITKAYIQFKVDERSVNDADIIIHGESTANALGFTKTDYNISDRNKTNTSVSWSPAGWNTVGAAGEEQRSSDLTAIVQEIISETGWSNGNAMAFIFTGTGTRTAEAYNGEPAGAPLLYVEYSSE